MSLFEITENEFKAIESSSLIAMNLCERGDLQRLLRTQIDVLSSDLYVLAEEFSDWYKPPPWRLRRLNPHLGGCAA